MKFFTAGIPLSTQGNSTEKGLLRVKELGLDGMELEFVRGIKMSEDKAKKVKKISQENNLYLSVHAPYWINLNAKEKDKLKASIERIYESARIGFLAGARNITFHPAYYVGDDPKDVHRRVKEILKEIVSRLKDEKIDVILRPETTGKPTQYGSLDEILELSAEIENVLPCIDFAHLHARSGGKFNSVDEFRYVLEKVNSYLGERGIKEMHVHMSGIAYSPKGEKHHLNLDESDLRWREILEVLCEFGADGFIVSESPNIEGDAILMRDYWKKICGS